MIAVSVLVALFVAMITSCDSAPQPTSVEPKQPTLTQLCEFYPTDKCPFHHNYVEIYDMLFGSLRNGPLRLLEIGVFKGDSMRLWEAYFPEGRIFGIDIIDRAQHNTSRIKTFIADQGDRKALARIIESTGGEFDIVIDDGGHRMDQQQVSIGTLFPTLKPGGFYVIEDIHTSFPDRYPGYGVEPDGRNSTYAMIDHFVRTQRVQSPYLTEAENNYLTNQIAYCGYFFRANKYHSDLFVCRKK